MKAVLILVCCITLSSGLPTKRNVIATSKQSIRNQRQGKQYPVFVEPLNQQLLQQNAYIEPRYAIPQQSNIVLPYAQPRQAFLPQMASRLRQQTRNKFFPGRVPTSLLQTQLNGMNPQPKLFGLLPALFALFNIPQLFGLPSLADVNPISALTGLTDTQSAKLNLTALIESLSDLGLGRSSENARITFPIRALFEGFTNDVLTDTFPSLTRIPSFQELFDLDLENLISLDRVLEEFPLLPAAIPTPDNIARDITRVVSRAKDPNYPGIPIMEVDDDPTQEVTGVYIKRPEFITDIMRGVLG